MNYFVKNVNYLMSCKNLSNYTELADKLNVNLSTLKSLIKNPKSNSKLKPLIAEYFGITINQLDNYDLSINKDNCAKEYENNIRNNTQFSNIPIEDLDSVYFYKEFLKEDLNIDEELLNLKKSICSKFSLKYRVLVTEIRELKNNDMLDKAVVLFFDNFLNLSDESLKKITKEDVELFIDLFEKTNSFNMLEKFVLRFVNSYCVSPNVLFHLYSILVKDHAELSKECLKRIEKFDDIF